MKSATFLGTLSLAFLLGAGLAHAQGTDEDPGDEGELTITLIPDPEADLPEAVTKTIELPEAASDEGRMRSTDGRAIADDRLELRQAGLDTAAEAREFGREFGENMAEAAKENRENFSRGNAPDLPELPDLPDLPDGPNPNPPNPPGPPGP